MNERAGCDGLDRGQRPDKRTRITDAALVDLVQVRDGKVRLGDVGLVKYEGKAEDESKLSTTEGLSSIFTEARFRLTDPSETRTRNIAAVARRYPCSLTRDSLDGDRVVGRDEPPSRRSSTPFDT